MTDEDIRSMNIKESFLTLTQYLPDLEEHPSIAETYKKARFGIQIKFDIYDYINEMLGLKEKSGKIIYRGKPIDMTSFWTELEQRNIMIKKWIEENIEEEGSVSGYDIQE